MERLTGNRKTSTRALKAKKIQKDCLLPVREKGDVFPYLISYLDK